MNTPELHFLGWDEPAIELVAAKLLEGLSTPQTADQYRRATVVVPTEGSGRRLREYMAELAGKEGKALLMPTITLAGHLIPSQGSHVASEMETAAAWLHVLGESMGDKPLQWLLDVTTQMQRVRKQLEQEARSPEWEDGTARNFVRNHLQEPDEAWENTLRYEQERWQALRAAFAGVDAQLERWNLLPAEQARADELENPRPRGLLIIACVPELSPLNRLYLQRLADTGSASVQIWVNAPAHEAERFDTYGQPLPTIAIGPHAGMGWSECPIDIPLMVHPVEMNHAISASNVIHITGCASAFGEKVRELAGGCHSDEVVLASCDNALSPMLVSAFRPEWQINMPEGRSLMATEAGQLFLQLRDALAVHNADAPLTSNSMEDILTLLRNYTLQCILGQQEVQRSFNHFLTELCNKHLPSSTRHLRHLMHRMQDAPPTPWKSGQIRSYLQYTEDVLILLDDCTSEKQMPNRLRKLAAALQRVLSAPEQKQACRILCGLLDEAANLVANRDISCSPQTALLLMAHMMQKQAGGILEGAGERSNAINLRGWRELSFTREPRLIIAGMHDGCVPERMPVDAYLPQAYRAFLGMTNDATRSARDSFLLTALLHSRPAGKVQFVLAACAPDGTPIAPSPLLLRCNSPAETAQRVAWLFTAPQENNGHAPYGQLPLITPEYDMLPGIGMEPVDLIAPGIPNPYADPGRTFSPSAIKDFLNCPLRFWLKKLLKIAPGDALEEHKSEPDAAEYGTLLHAILQDITTRYASADKGTDTDTLAAGIATYATERTKAHIAELYGYESAALPAPISILQRNVCKTVQAFALLHAADLCDGWEVIKCEELLILELPLENGGPPLLFDMRVDRVDRHRDGRMRVIDYKTNASDPRKTHWEKLTDSSASMYRRYMPESLIITDNKGDCYRWNSVQLPLYAEALRNLCLLTSLPECGFYNMPRNKPGEVKYTPMSGLESKSAMTRELHEQAMDCVKAAAGLMRDGLCLYTAESLGRSLSYDNFGTLCIHKDSDPRIMCSLPPLATPLVNN